MKRMCFGENKYLIFDQPKVLGLSLLKNCVWGFFCSAFYKLLYWILPVPTKTGFKYNVSLCTIFKDEGDYLKEWIEFHKIVGIEHFYLYNNGSSDNYMEVLKPYIDLGTVTLKDWPKPQSQMEMYNDFFKEFAKDTLWVGFIDLDEYVVPNKMDTIYDFLIKFNNRASVIIYWKFFGTSGLMNRDKDSLMVRDFTISWPKYADIGKFFFNTRYVYSPNYKLNNYMHSTWAKLWKLHLPPVNPFDRIVSYGCNFVPNADMPIQINHYVIKSYYEYIEKKAKRGGGVHPIGMHDMDYFLFHESKCQATDFHIYRFLIKLELAMQSEVK